MNLFRFLFGWTCMFCGNTVDPRCADGICGACAREISQRRLVIPAGENLDTVSVYYFDEPVRGGLHRFKYNGKIALGRFCGRQLAERYRQRGDRAHVVTCVPRAKDGRPRLYNQSAVIAKAVARDLKLPFDPDLLSKRKGMLTQPECSTHLAREKNAKRAYRKGPSERDLTGQTVLLVDDLYTTGATANACCAVLKKRGAKEILIYTAMRVRPMGNTPLVPNVCSRHVHAEFTDPAPYRNRRFRRNTSGGFSLQ